MDQTKRLFVRSGGGMPGLDIHAGLWQALSEAGIHATACAGTSAGAIISALDASEYTSQFAWAMLGGLRDQDVRRDRFAWRARLAWIDHILDVAPIRQVMAQYLHGLISQTAKPLEACAVLKRTSEPVLFGPWSEGVDLLEAVMASMSIAGIWPAVEIHGELHTDGGTARNLPLPGTWRSHDEVWLLVATPPLDYAPRRESVVSNMLHNVHMLQEGQIANVLARVHEHRVDMHGAAAKRPHVFVLRPAVGRTSGTLRFDHELRETARAWAARRIGELVERAGGSFLTEARGHGGDGELTTDGTDVHGLGGGS